MDAKTTVGHDQVRPDLREQLTMGYDLSRSACQDDEDVEGAAADGDGLRVLPEKTAGG